MATEGSTNFVVASEEFALEAKLTENSYDVKPSTTEKSVTKKSNSIAFRKFLITLKLWEL